MKRITMVLALLATLTFAIPATTMAAPGNHGNHNGWYQDVGWRGGWGGPYRYGGYYGRGYYGGYRPYYGGYGYGPYSAYRPYGYGGYGYGGYGIGLGPLLQFRF